MKYYLPTTFKIYKILILTIYKYLKTNKPEVIRSYKILTDNSQVDFGVSGRGPLKVHATPVYAYILVSHVL